MDVASWLAMDALVPFVYFDFEEEEFPLCIFLPKQVQSACDDACETTCARSCMGETFWIPWCLFVYIDFEDDETPCGVCMLWRILRLLSLRWFTFFGALYLVHVLLEHVSLCSMDSGVLVTEVR